MNLSIPQQEEQFDASLYETNAGCVSILDIDLSQEPRLPNGQIVNTYGKVLDSPRTLEAMAA